LTMRDGQQVVFTLVDQAALQTPVTIGRKLGDVTEIISGLSMSDVVLLSPPGSLLSGDKVEAGN